MRRALPGGYEIDDDPPRIGFRPPSGRALFRHPDD
jgi:hypothetical protein